VNFIVHFLGDGGGDGCKPRVLRTVAFDADDLYAVVARTRIILSLRSYEPSITAFQIVSDDGRVMHQERREEIEAGSTEPCGSSSPFHGPSSTLAPTR
jgi:hypothetical protein